MFLNKTKYTRINLRALALRGKPDYSKVTDEEFPAEIGTEGGEEDTKGTLRTKRIAALREQLVKPVPAALCRIGRGSRNLKGKDAEAAKARAEFYASRVLIKIKRARNSSSLPDEYNPIECRVNGIRFEFPNDRWVAAPPATIEVMQNSHSELKVKVESREPPKDLPAGSDLAFPGMKVEYTELKNYVVLLALPPSAYAKRSAA